MPYSTDIQIMLLNQFNSANKKLERHFSEIGPVGSDLFMIVIYLCSLPL